MEDLWRDWESLSYNLSEALIFSRVRPGGPTRSSTPVYGRVLDRPLPRRALPCVGRTTASDKVHGVAGVINRSTRKVGGWQMTQVPVPVVVLEERGGDLSAMGPRSCGV